MAVTTDYPSWAERYPTNKDYAEEAKKQQSEQKQSTQPISFGQGGNVFNGGGGNQTEQKQSTQPISFGQGGNVFNGGGGNQTQEPVISGGASAGYSGIGGEVSPTVTYGGGGGTSGNTGGNDVSTIPAFASGGNAFTGYQSVNYPKENTVANQLQGKQSDGSTVTMGSFPAQQLGGVRSTDYYMEKIEDTPEGKMLVAYSGTGESRGFGVWGGDSKSYFNVVNPSGSTSTYSYSPESGDKVAFNPTTKEINIVKPSGQVPTNSFLTNINTGEMLYTSQGLTGDSIYQSTKQHYQDMFGKTGGNILLATKGFLSAPVGSTINTLGDMSDFFSSKLYGKEYSGSSYLAQEKLQKEAFLTSFGEYGQSTAPTLSNPFKATKDTLTYSPVARVVAGAGIFTGVGAVFGATSALGIGSGIGTLTATYAPTATTLFASSLPTIASYSSSLAPTIAGGYIVKRMTKMESQGFNTSQIFESFAEEGANLYVGAKAFELGYGASSKAITNAIAKNLDKKEFEISGIEYFNTESGSYSRLRLARASKFAKQEIEFNSPMFNIVKKDVFAVNEFGERTLIEKGSGDYSYFITGGKVRTKMVSPIFKNTISDVTKGFTGQISLSGDDIYQGFKLINNKGILIGDTTKGSLFTAPMKGVQEFNDFTVGYGKGILKMEGSDTFQTFKIAGSAKEVKGGYQVTSFKNLRYTQYQEGVVKAISPLRADISGSGFISKYADDGYAKFYHVTSDKYAKDILSGGLKPSGSTGNYQGIAKPLDFVSTGESKEWAKSFASRTAVKKGGSATVFEIKIPKADLPMYQASSTKLSGIGGEFRFNYVPPKYITQLEQRGQEFVNPIEEALSKEGARSLLTQMSFGSEVGNRFLKQSSELLAPRTKLVLTYNFGRTKQYPTPNLSPSFALDTNTRTRFNRQQFNTMTQPSFIQPTAQNFVYGSSQSFKTDESFKQPTQQIQINPPTPSWFNPTFTPGLPPPIWFPSGSFGETQVYRKRRGKKVKYGYQPSFTSIALGIYGKPKKIGTSYGPLRPIPLGFKPRRTKRSKRKSRR